MGAMGVEGAAFSAGYGLPEAVGELYDGRKPEEVMTTFMGDVGTGLVIGAALPAVFHFPGVAAGKLFRGVSNVANKGINLAADTKMSNEFFDAIVKGIVLSDPERYAAAQARADLREQLSHHTNVDDALKAFRSLVSRKEEITVQVGRQMDDVLRSENSIRLIDQQGHKESFILKKLEEIERGTDGAASATVFLDMALNGMEGQGKKTAVQGGLFDFLEREVMGIIADGQKVMTHKGVEQELQHGAIKELTLILEEIQGMRKASTDYVETMVNKISGPERRAMAKRAAAEGLPESVSFAEVEFQKTWEKAEKVLREFQVRMEKKVNGLKYKYNYTGSPHRYTSGRLKGEWGKPGTLSRAAEAEIAAAEKELAEALNISVQDVLESAGVRQASRVGPTGIVGPLEEVATAEIAPGLKIALPEAFQPYQRKLKAMLPPVHKAPSALRESRDQSQWLESRLEQELISKKKGKPYFDQNMTYVDPWNFDHVVGDGDRAQKIVRHFMSDPSIRGRLTRGDKKFLANMYSRLELLSARFHRQIKKGPLQDIANHQDMLNHTKRNLTSFLTNSSDGGWNVPRSIRQGENQLTPFGRMAEEKGIINELKTNRDEQHKFIDELFFKPDPLAPKTDRVPNLTAIEEFINKLDHKTSKDNMAMFEDLAERQAKLLSLLASRFNLPAGQSRRKLLELINRSNAQKVATKKGIEDLTTKMKPALEYYAILERERIAGLSGANPSLLPYAFGAGVGAMFGGPAGAGVGLAGGAAFRFSQEMILNPGRSMAKLHTFFRTVNVQTEFIGRQVDRYFKWLNFAKDVPATGPKALYDPKATRPKWSKDKHENIKKPRLWTSFAIAKMVTNNAYEEPKGKPSPAKDLEKAKVISTALEDPEVRKRVVSAVTTQWEAVDPALAEAMGKNVIAHLDRTKELLKDIKRAEPGPFGDPHKYLTDDVTGGNILRKIHANNRGTPIILRGLYEGTLTRDEVEEWRRAFPQEAINFTQTVMAWLAEPTNRAGIQDIDRKMLEMIVGVDSYDQATVMVLAKAFESKEKPGPEPRPGMKNLPSAETAIQRVESRIG